MRTVKVFELKQSFINNILSAAVVTFKYREEQARKNGDIVTAIANQQLCSTAESLYLASDHNVEKIEMHYANYITKKKRSKK